MGGLGSGEWVRQIAKRGLVDDCLILSMSDLRGQIFPSARGHLQWTNGDQQVGALEYFVAGCDLAPILTLQYIANDRESIRIPIEIQTTPTRFNGLRRWFTCPLIVNGVACGRRVGKLYLPKDATYFGCRDCYQLTYQSSQQAHPERKDRTIWKHALKLAPDLASLLPSQCPMRSQVPAAER